MSICNSFTSSPSPDENFIFECDQHAANIYKKLQNFYEAKDFFDTILIAGEDCIEIPTHKIVLSALSEYFWEIFHSKPTISQEVVLKEIDASTLKLILDYMYSGSIRMNLEEIETLLRSAVILKMKNLIDGCCDFIEKNLNDINSLDWFCLAKELSLSGLQEKSLNFIYKHLENVTKEATYLLLDKTQLKDLLFNDNPHGDLEEQVFLSLMAWIEYEKENRQDLLFEMLSMVRFQFLTPKFIIENIYRSKTEETCELIHSWLKYHLSPESRTIEQQNFVSSSGSSLLRKEVNLNEEKSKIAIININNNNEAEIKCYNEQLKTWSLTKRSRPLLTKISSYSMIVIDKNLFLVGGITNDGTGTISNAIQCLDIESFKLIDLPPMRVARYQSQLGNLNGNLCVFGGFGKSNCSNFVDSVEIFNFSTRKWSDLQPIFETEERNKINCHNGILYIFDFRYGHLQCYDVSTNEWTSKDQPIDDKVGDFRIASNGNLVYILCSCEHYYPHRNSPLIYYRQVIVKCFDLPNNVWSEVAELTGDAQCVKIATFIGNNLFFLRNDIIYEFNPDTKPLTSLGRVGSSNFCFLPFKL